MTLIGKMQRRLERDASNKTAERVDEHLEASGKDGLELAARVCAVAYKGVKERLPANREYRTGYAMALAELAVVLRGMRRGEHPRADEMAEARRGVVAAIEEEFDGAPAQAYDGGAASDRDVAVSDVPEVLHGNAGSEALETPSDRYTEMRMALTRVVAEADFVLSGGDDEHDACTECGLAGVGMLRDALDPARVLVASCARCGGSRRIESNGLSFPCPECAS